MFRNDSPLETLAAFGIAFIAGALLVSGVNLYCSYTKRKIDLTK